MLRALTGKHPVGKGEEQALAAVVLGLLCVQLGPGPKGEELFHSLRPLLFSVLSDSTASPAARLHVSMSMPHGPLSQSRMSGSTYLQNPDPKEGEPHVMFLLLSHGSLALSSSRQCASALGLGCYVAATDVQVSGLWTWVTV